LSCEADQRAERSEAGEGQWRRTPFAEGGGFGQTVISFAGWYNIRSFRTDTKTMKNRVTIFFSSKMARVGFLLVFCAFLAIYYLAARDAGVHVGGDTTAFEAVARDQLSWSNIFFTQRPPLYPLLFKLFDDERERVVDVQVLAYVAAWGFLAWSFFRTSRGPPALLLVAATFFLALFPTFAAWNQVLMSESLACSMTVISFAFLVRFLSGGTTANLIAFVGMLCLRSFLRDFDAFFCLFFVPVILLFGAARRISWRLAATLAVTLVACFVFVSYSAEASGHATNARWYFAMLDNIGQRVLPDPAWRSFFVAHGMPMNDALDAMTGHWAHEKDWKFFADPALEDFRRWLTLHGRGTYAALLLQRPLFTLLAPLAHAQEVFQPHGFPLSYYFDPAYHTTIPPRPDLIVIYAFDAAGFLALSLLLPIGRVPTPFRLTALVVIGLSLMLVPLALVIYHADPMELVRHAVPVPLHAALLALLLLQLVLSHGWSTLSNGK
jgi:hypothetical protein